MRIGQKRLVLALESHKTEQETIGRPFATAAGRKSVTDDKPRLAEGGGSSPPRLNWHTIKHVGVRVKQELSSDNLSIVSAGCAFYAVLALFPAMAAIVSVYGLAFNPAEVETQFGSLRGFLPGQAHDLLMNQLGSIAAAASTTLSWSLALSLTLVIWSANRGSKSMFKALNIVYGVKEKRGFLLLNARTLAFTAGTLFGLAVALAVIVAVPIAFAVVGLGSAMESVVDLARWPLLAGLLIAALAALYRYGPCRDHPGWRWLLPGAVAAAFLWIVGSILFSAYVAGFGSYEQTFGSLGAVIILLLWLYLSAFVVLLGGELNAVLEQRFRTKTSDSRTEERSPSSADHGGASAH